MESRRTPDRDRTFALFPDLAPLQKLYYHGRQRRYRVRFESHRVHVQVKGLGLVIGVRFRVRVWVMIMIWGLYLCYGLELYGLCYNSLKLS